MAKVSVIIPIYNVEKYLPRALDSLIAQTFRDWEAILVDDGSPDGSAAVMADYASRDSRFVEIHSENRGASEARNLGIKSATGDYVLYLDSDDFLHPQTMELTVGLAERDGSDIVTFTFDHSYRTRAMVRQYLRLPDPKPSFRKYCNPETLTTNNIFDYATEYSHPEGIEKKWAVKHCQAWRALYRTEIVRDIPFIKDICYEDFPWWGEVLLRVRKATILNLPLYFYYPNLTGLILHSNEEKKIKGLEIGIAAAEKAYSEAPKAARDAWEKNFMVPFRQKLEKKKNG